MKELELTIGFILAIEQGNMERLASLLADDLIFSGPLQKPMNKSAFMSFITGLLHGIPNWRSHFREVDVDGPFVSMTIEVTGAHLRTLYLPGMLPHAPTGESFHLPPERLQFFIDGEKIRRIHLEPVEGGWINGMLDQLGILQPAVN